MSNKPVTREEFDRLFKMDSAIVSSLQSKLRSLEERLDNVKQVVLHDHTDRLSKLESIRIMSGVKHPQSPDDTIARGTGSTWDSPQVAFDYLKLSIGTLTDRLSKLESQIANLDKNVESIDDELHVTFPDGFPSINERLDSLEQVSEWNTNEIAKDAAFFADTVYGTDVREGIHDRLQSIERRLDQPTGYEIEFHKFSAPVMRAQGAAMGFPTAKDYKCTRCGRYEIDIAHFQLLPPAVDKPTQPPASDPVYQIGQLIQAAGGREALANSLKVTALGTPGSPTRAQVDWRETLLDKAAEPLPTHRHGVCVVCKNPFNVSQAEKGFKLLEELRDSLNNFFKQSSFEGRVELMAHPEEKK